MIITYEGNLSWIRIRVGKIFYYDFFVKVLEIRFCSFFYADNLILAYVLVHST